jgi:hypothetical protein
VISTQLDGDKTHTSQSARCVGHPHCLGHPAATALVHGLTVATMNVADFERTGVGVVNPWEA